MFTEWNRRWTLPLIVCLLIGSAPGCINLAANLIHAVRGNDRPAEYDGLTGKRVAVVVGTDKGLGNDTTSTLLTSYIQALMNTHLEDADVIAQRELEQWLDSHNGSDADYFEIGKGVNADVVVAVDVTNLSLKNGATLYRGQADISVSVFDVASGGKILYRKQMPEFAFPKLDGVPTTDTSIAKFRGAFLGIVAEKVAGLFYPVDPTTDFALDATSGSF